MKWDKNTWLLDIYNEQRKEREREIRTIIFVYYNSITNIKKSKKQKSTQFLTINWSYLYMTSKRKKKRRTIIWKTDFSK